MFTLFVITSILMWIFGLATRISFCFKEEYKKYYGKLFEEDGLHRPYQWSLSRQKNHNVYVGLKYLTCMFAVVSILLGVFVCDILHLIAIIALPLVIVLPLGKIIGKYLCRNSVRNQCRKFKIPIKIWFKLSRLKNLHGNSMKVLL